MAILTLRRRNGDTFNALIDDDDAERVKAVGTWNLDARGYVVRARRGEPAYKLHRFVLGFGPGDPTVDHRNGDKLDNRKENLVPRTQRHNSQNLAAVNYRGSSKYRGVTWHARSGKWRATARLNRKAITLGLHETQEQAYETLVAWRRIHLPHDERGISGAA